MSHLNKYPTSVGIKQAGRLPLFLDPALQRRLDNAFSDTFSLNGGLRIDIDGDKRISAFRDGMMITQHILKQGTSDSPWAPPGFNPPAGFPAQMQQHLKDLIGF